MKRFEGRVAAVTGGGSGIGAAICRRLADEGATVAALDLSVDRAQEIVAELPRGAAIEADVSDSGSVEEALTKVETDLGPLAIMVNNAGALAMSHVARVNPLIEQQRAEQAVGPITTPLEALVRLTDEEWRFVLSVHLDGTFYGTRAAVRRMAERRSGAIVNMASVCGIEGCTGHPHYSAAKAGVLGFTRATAKEVIVQGIRVNAIAPGFIDTTRTKAQVGVAREVNVDTHAGRAARHPGGGGSGGRVPRLRRCRLLRRRHREPERRARHRGLTLRPASARWTSSAMRRAISAHSSRGRSWPIPSNTTSSAPGIAPAVARPPLTSTSGSSAPCSTSVGTETDRSAAVLSPDAAMATSCRPTPIGSLARS